MAVLTQEGGGRHRAVAPGNHHADARLHEGHGEVDDLRSLLVDGQRADGHVGPLVEDLWAGQSVSQLVDHLECQSASQQARQ